MEKFFETFVRLILKNRKLVAVLGMGLFAYGVYQTITSPVDILPDLNRPSVTIFVESEGLATEEVELLVTTPLESVMNGANGVERVRSVSSPGLSLVFVDFDWDQDIYLARQIVGEKLNSVQLPEGSHSTLGPISSIMGEVQFLGLSSPTGKTSAKELRNLADWTVRQKLLTVPGVAAVTVIGGERQQYQILADPVKLSTFGISINTLEERLGDIVTNKSGNFLVGEKAEYPIRIIAQTHQLADLENTIVGERDGYYIYLKDVADVIKGHLINVRGDAGINGRDGVILSIKKQPGANTLKLLATIETALEGIEAGLGEDVKIHYDLFTQEKFIQNGINNVVGATRDAAILVILILLLFLANVRAMAITLTALPFAFVTAILILRNFGIEINVMTLGGLAVAIGELTDDAVVGVENTIRWFRENKQRAHPLSPFEIVVRASTEVRGSVIFSTILVVLVFSPLFALANIEGRLLAPLGIAYITALVASTFVALTVTSILCYWLLPGSKLVKEGLETKLVRKVKAFSEPIIKWSIRYPKFGLGLAFISLFLTIGIAVQAGKEFLPPFNEGSLTLNVALPPGTSITGSKTLGTKIEKSLLEIDGVLSTARRTGRAEEDEHASSVNVSEVDVSLDEARDTEAVIEDIKEKLSKLDLEGANVSIGQPISHRIEHILSGVRAPLVIKVFGPDLDELSRVAEEVKELLVDIPGTLNPIVQPEVSVPQISIVPRRAILSQYGFEVGEFTEILETLLSGRELGTILEGNRSFDLTIGLDPRTYKNLESLKGIIITTPSGLSAPLSQLAEVREVQGRNSVSHDNGQRRIVVSSGILDGDSGTIIDTLKEKVRTELELPAGYFLSYEGTYKSQQESTKRLTYLAILAFIGIVVSLFFKFPSLSLVAQILANVPAVFLGGMIAVYFTGNVISLASLVGLISLLGLGARNGILLIENWISMMKDGVPFGEDLIVRGALNRLSPMLITALTSMLALLPLIIGGTASGKEIIYPLAVVTFGGLLVSILVEIIVRPGLFKLFGEKASKKIIDS